MPYFVISCEEVFFKGHTSIDTIDSFQLKIYHTYRDWIVCPVDEYVEHIPYRPYFNIVCKPAHHIEFVTEEEYSATKNNCPREDTGNNKHENNYAYVCRKIGDIYAFRGRSGKVQCICGGVYTYRNKSKHERTSKHQEYMKRIT